MKQLRHKLSRRFGIALATFFVATQVMGQVQAFDRWPARIDSLIQTTSIRPFNGKVLIAQGGKPLYEKSYGATDILQKTAFKPHDQFVIGSVSKQVTAVLVLQAVDAGLLDLHAPIHRYMPELPRTWADTMTAHHLLNHTSGIIGKDTTLAFVPGSRFSYSNTGYNLLGELAARVQGKTYEELVMALFHKCKMRHSSTPTHPKAHHLVQGFAKQTDGKIVTEKLELSTNYAPSAHLISCPADLVRWNDMLHTQKKLLSKTTYGLMVTPSSTRDHPIFGNVDYGYGLQFTHTDSLYEISHGGYAPGFVTINFYYPATQTSLIVMENLDWKDPAFKDSYHFGMEIRRLLREHLLLSSPAEKFGR